jgi:hypothetical protein
MKDILGYIREFVYEVNKMMFGLVTLLAALLIYVNYQYQLDRFITNHHSFWYSLVARYLIFLVAFLIPYLLAKAVKGKRRTQVVFIVLLLIAPAIFSFKAALNINVPFSDNIDWNKYWNYVFYWPINFITTACILFLVWKSTNTAPSFYGVSKSNVNWRPYFMMLLIMVPLVAVASSQADFLTVYPKLKLMGTGEAYEQFSWWHKLVFELSYGSDFFTIELFFRGFLILGFMKWVGKDAILPMACFYCTIHFGKPLGECISSYFGGIILGIVVYNTRSILGGLLVHLGIAWMMEIGGYIGSASK